MSGADVAAVVVNWNQRELLLEAVGSLHRSRYSSLSVIVVDNGSTDGSADEIELQYPGTAVIRNWKNLGFAIGCNQGLERALNEGARFVLFLNSDAVVDERTVGVLVRHLETHPGAAAVAPLILYHHRPDIIWFGGGEVKLWRGWVGHRHIRRRFDPGRHRPSPTDYLTGCVFLARARVLKEFGGFDETYGLYAEDVDLSLRLRGAGWELWVTPEAKAWHRVSASTGGEMSPFKAFHRGRSSAVLFKRFTPWWGFPTLMLGGFAGGSAATVRLVLSGRLQTALALWHGVICGMLNLPQPKRYALDFSQLNNIR